MTTAALIERLHLNFRDTEAAEALERILAAWQNLRTKTVVTESALFAELKRAIEGEG